jgi:hypothetical protein
MITSLVLLTQVFAASDPCATLRDLQHIRDRGFDLRTGVGSLQFQPAQPRKIRYQSFATRALWDPWTASYIQVYVHFPSLYSDATVANDGYGLDTYSQPDAPLFFQPII